jgi:hypothetical protein
MHWAGGGVGMLMIIAYAFQRIKRGYKTQNDTDSIVGFLILVLCGLMVWALARY